MWLLLLLQAGARYAEGLLKALGVQQAILVGHSAGALTAMELFKRCVHRLPALCEISCLDMCFYMFRVTDAWGAGS